MANKKHLAMLRQGRMVWQQWRIENPFIEPDLSSASLTAADFRIADLSNADLRNADLTDADLTAAKLTSAKLRSAKLRSAKLRNADLRSAKLRNADLTDADLTAADLTAAKLTAADLSYTKLSNAKLSNADLSNADLHSVDLSYAKLSNADFSNANLRYVDLTAADLTATDLSYATLRSATLRSADLSDAKIGWTVFVDVDLSEIEGLETIEHFGPSSIGIDTIYRSKGNIPFKFLLDAGIPKDDIAYLLSLAGKAIDFYSCFISYSSQDQAFAERLHADLQAKGVRCWYAPEDLTIGEPILSGIDKGIRLHDKLLLVLSTDSVTSRWVEHEVEAALAEELRPDRKTKMLFPIRLDNAIMETAVDWSYRIRQTRHIGDFTQWKDHDAYQKALARLLRDLKMTT